MEAIDRHLAEHHGVISRAEALRLGMSPRTISRRLEQRRWKPSDRGVYRLAGAPATWAGDARSLALGIDGLISHRAAARVWRIDGFDRAPLEATVDARRAPGPRPGITIHRSTQLALAGRSTRRGIPVTGVARTVLDLAAVLPLERSRETIDAAIRQRLVRWHDLMGVLVRHSRKGRNGCGVLRVLLDERYGGERPPDSAFNRMVGQLLVDAGVGRPTFEHELFDGDRFVARVDLAFSAHRLAIELDSRRHHDNEWSFVEDRRRANRIVNLGWTLLMFTWDDYREAPHLLVDTVRRAMGFCADSAPHGGV